MKPHLKPANRFSLIIASVFIPCLISAPSALANCNDRVGTIEYYKPAMQRRWAQLQAQTTYPWGDARVYDTLEGSKIRLSPAFDKLSRQEKKQAIELIGFDYGEATLRQLLTPVEKQTQAGHPGGAMSPYEVVTYDGRLVYTAFDGCTPMILLSERDRYSYYTLRRPTIKKEPNGDREPVSEIALRNAGNPFWRNATVLIAEENERRVRLLFWQTVGYSQVEKGWWIAWVPEQGLFEISVPSGADQSVLNRFLSIAPQMYLYAVLK
ncbi:MAG: phosphoribosylaminoimidazolesuccinocarboxamide synthase [Cyanobacteria bacterium P01_F01_bin.3]